MNPPSAIHGSMSRDKKPFTYTPGGLDLSEIKSERMAKRLMRNAMNEGVPQQPVQSIQSPPASTIAVPNFNCLPVQVFPAFNLPANPKSLLRTRSNPVSREPPLQRVAPPSQFVNNKAPVQYDTFNKNTPPYSQINNNRPTSMFEYGAPGTTPIMNYGNDACNPTFLRNDGYNAAFPEISYDAQYFRAQKINNCVENTAPFSTIKNTVENDKNGKTKKEDEIFAPKIDLTSDNNHTQKEEFNVAPAFEYKESVIDIKPEIVTSAPETIVVSESPIQEDVFYNNKQKEVKIVTKATKTENQNGEQNGDTEAVMTVKLPTKKSAAKTETKVEISKKSLPDGSIEEVKKTITKTTIDGKTEIKTKTETTIIPKDDEEEEVEDEAEEEENSEEEVQEVHEQETKENPTSVNKKVEETSTETRENGQENIIKTEERSETTTTSTKKVVIIQNDKEDETEPEDIEEEIIEEAKPVTVILKKSLEIAQEHIQDEEETKLEDDEEVKVERIEKVEEKEKDQEVKVEHKVEPENEGIQKKAAEPEENEEEVEEEVDEEEQYEEAEEKEVEVKVEKVIETTKIATKEEDEVSEYTDEEIEAENELVSSKLVEKTVGPTEETKSTIEEIQTPVEKLETSAEKSAAPIEIEIPIQKESDEKQEVIVEKQEQIKQEVIEETKTEKLEAPEPKVPLREPSVPLEKVEDVEIKPIGAGNFVTKTRTETTEIITGTGDKPTGLLTEYNRTENIVTVNRTTKTLDYENPTQQTIPTLTYFTPHIEKFPPSPQPTSRPYQPVYPSEPTSERRHSLLLERLSMERQIPTNEIYQNTQQHNQTVEQQNQWSQEPRVEILTIENVKPSSITNQQWYQQTDKKDVIYNNVAPVTPSIVPSWTQPKQQQPVYQPPAQPAYQPPAQPAYQPQTQTTYQAQHQPKPVYQPQQPQSVYQAQPQYHPQSVTQSQAQPQYQSSYTENLQQNTSSQQNNYSSQQTYSTYIPKPSNWASNLDTPSTNTQNQYSSDSYQNTQQRPSSYVPPPWEQDSTYVVDNSQNYYQPPQNTFTPDLNQDWKSTLPTAKFSKTTPTAYIPPKPNQSFVKHVTIAEPSKQPGRKTYYSEYERRYISVPESTYIPGETKPQPQQSQPQPDPSPAYYYDNNEPAETVEHEWRKELRQFTEKAQTQPENVKPPWESSIESKTQTQYAKTQETTYTATPTWSQTLRPQSWRERSFESEFVSQEWPKTNTLGRGRPLSSYGKESSSMPERTRGVSVDRYNPNNYQSPVPEPHPPVQTFTHNPPASHGAGYHNPNVPAYHAHARASAEPREQQVYQQPRARVESRASPFQSRSFKYLQWITGTED